jgi:oxygen-independent coproporphyrinogen-3 oxidase
MRLLKDGREKFDLHFPIYNWLYPTFLQEDEVPKNTSGTSFFKQIDNSKIKARALYFHIPFCETICSFCPFEKSGFRNYDYVQEYVDALINEIRIKSQIPNIINRPVEVIFFGGGTPSILNPEQILRIGREIHNSFDTSRLKEFSFEIEVKSISKEKLLAMREIGVTHGRFGLQTFNEKYRKLFNLTSTMDQIHQAIEMLNSTLNYFSFDMIYGMNGQTDDEFEDDIINAAKQNTLNIDFYPLNNYVSQIALHRAFRSNNLFLNSPYRKLEMNVRLKEKLNELGFIPHNGHGYFRTTKKSHDCPIITDDYTFHYHKHVYGYDDRDIVGFGNSAVSIFNGYSTINEAKRGKYISSLKSYCLDYTIGKHNANAAANKAVLMHLPYFGYIDKNRVNWSEIYQETKIALEELKTNKLIEETQNQFRLTQIGWYWYVNLMYYLSPKFEKESLNSYIKSISADKNRIVELTQIE